ncbi:RNase P modulator RnpM [Terribacillus sp. JSM ZJ617]|uniref:RNase P modulator RnpM n=1 Tax=Terribacillus sp. JSM ZJ617 TaxID=3342119 RepID=UPI0035A93DA0
MKQKKVPLRKCVVSNEMKPKQELIRVVRSKEGDVFVDETGKKNGRGAYVSKDAAIIEKAKKQDTLARHLNTQIDDSIYEELARLAKGQHS